MSQETIEDLLVEWEVARQEGRPVSVMELCADHPDLLAEVGERIEKLKSTSWMLDDATNTDEGDLDKMETLADSDVTVADFVDSVAESGVLSEPNLKRLRRDYLPADDDQLAAELAARFVRDGLLTDYQAAVLLKRKDGPLLLDRYVILDVVGSGGMGFVFKALHRSMERIVALKVLPPFAVDSPDKIARFEREIKAAAKLSHPNIVAAYDAHEANGTYFLVLEYVEGVDLWQHIRERGPLAVDDAVRIAVQISEALAEAHRQEIVHRDIKPSNILLSPEGNAKLLDLGLARVKRLEQHEGNDELTRDGLAMGTAAFMSPEQALNAKRADVRSDIYSLGCTLYYLLVGQAPFDRDTTVETIVAHREEDVPSLRDARDDVPPTVDAAFRRMMAKDADDRPQSMDEVRAELLACGVIGDEHIHHRTTSDALAAPRSKMQDKATRSSRWAIGLSVAGLAIVAMVLIGVMLAWLHRDTQRDVAEWVLRAGGMVEAETEFGQEEFYDTVELPTGDVRVVGVDLMEASVESIEPVLRLAHLRRLSVADVPVDKAELARIAQLTDLTELDLWSCSIRDEHLESIVGMNQLTSLGLIDNEITDAGLKRIAQLSNLTALYVGGTDITDAGLVELFRLTALQRLDLSLTQVTGRGIQSLSKLPRLRFLDLQDMTISVEQAEGLAELKQLTHLQFDYCTIPVEAIRRLQRLANLEALSVEGSGLSDVGLAQITTLSQLRQLDISDTNVTATGLRELGKLANLEGLGLANIALDDDVLSTISSLGQLNSLDLSGTSIGDTELQKLTGLKRLTILILDETNVTNSGAKRFENEHPCCTVVLDSWEFFGDDEPW